MTPVSVPQQNMAHERRSALLVVGLVILSLLIGWQVKTAIQNATRTVEVSGLTVNVPDGWLVQEGAGDLLFVARNPLAIDELYRVSQLPAEPDLAPDLAALAENRNLARARLDDSYRVLSAEPIVFAGRDGYKVSFARVDLDSPGIPHVIEGLDYYFPEGDRVNVLSLEAESESFADALPAFQRFAQSMTNTGG
ncbi:hypothetical protein [Candidatus Leptofilum sp.]|uniref:hypothetical protein n=1 Tax=Candidatus Leptofilum sp. TaxID=3241576 RepID=UPI003B5C2DC9